MISIDLEDFESWWKKGSFYEGHKSLGITEVMIAEKFDIRDDSVENMNDFIKIFDASNYYGLYKYPIDIYFFVLINLMILWTTTVLIKTMECLQLKKEVIII